MKWTKNKDSFTQPEKCVQRKNCFLFARRGEVRMQNLGFGLFFVIRKTEEAAFLRVVFFKLYMNLQISLITQLTPPPIFNIFTSTPLFSYFPISILKHNRPWAAARATRRPTSRIPRPSHRKRARSSTPKAQTRKVRVLYPVTSRRKSGEWAQGGRSARSWGAGVGGWRRGLGGNF